MSTAIQLTPSSNYPPASKTSSTAAGLSIASTSLALICLISLHVLSPEFDPSWRMVSEYALGNYSWVLSTMFLSWAIGTWSLAYALKREVKTTGGKIGLAFLVLAGIGEAMAAAFDVRHSLHGLAAMIGMPSLPVAAVLTSISLVKNPTWAPAKKRIMLTAHFTWISILVMTIAVMLLFDGFSKAGIDLSSGKAPATLPANVIALAGWANRLMILCYCVWVITVATHQRKLGGSTAPYKEAV